MTGRRFVLAVLRMTSFPVIISVLLVLLLLIGSIWLANRGPSFHQRSLRSGTVGVSLSYTEAYATEGLLYDR